MKKIIPALLLLIFCTPVFAQVTELETFRKNITQWVWYDQGKIDSIPRTDANTMRLKKATEASFLRFVLHPDSKNLDSLKAKAKGGGASYFFDEASYFFSTLRRNRMERSLENNADYSITLYGLYDYDLSHFVSLSIQPFTVGGILYVVYYYSTNGQGTYYIKDELQNKIVYTGTALTDKAPIQKFYRIDPHHFLLVEDMAAKGQRAVVLNTEKPAWTAIDAFKGKAFPGNTTDFSKKVPKEKRRYFWLASTKTLDTHYGQRYLTIGFDEATKTLSYTHVTDPSGKTVKTVEATWQNNLFVIDDYYLGEHLIDEPVPMQ